MDSEYKSLNSDEIGFFELMVNIWARRKVIGAITFLVSIVAIAYVMLVPPVYEAKFYVQPPSQDSVAHLNYGRGDVSGMKVLAVDDVYNVFLQHLQSESARYEYFDSVVLPTLSDDQLKKPKSKIFIEFSKSLTVLMPSKIAPQLFVVSLEHSDPVKAAQWVSGFVALVSMRAKEELINGVQSDARLKAVNLDSRVSGVKEIARKNRVDHIDRLREALAVARSIGLERPTSFLKENGSFTEVDGSLAYMRGSIALEAEIKNLQNRSSDEPFIMNLRHQESLSKFYRQLKIDPSQIAVYRQDGNIEPPHAPIKPKALLIIVLGAVMGLILGVFIALVLDFMHVKALMAHEDRIPPGSDSESRFIRPSA